MVCLGTHWACCAMDSGQNYIYHWVSISTHSVGDHSSNLGAQRSASDQCLNNLPKVCFSFPSVKVRRRMYSISLWHYHREFPQRIPRFSLFKKLWVYELTQKYGNWWKVVSLLWWLKPVKVNVFINFRVRYTDQVGTLTGCLSISVLGTS